MALQPDISPRIMPGTLNQPNAGWLGMLQQMLAEQNKIQAAGGAPSRTPFFPSRQPVTVAQGAVAEAPAPAAPLSPYQAYQQTAAPNVTAAGQATGMAPGQLGQFNPYVQQNVVGQKMQAPMELGANRAAQQWGGRAPRFREMGAIR